MEIIASLEQMAGHLGTLAKLLRLLAQGGVTTEHLQHPIDNKKARGNLAAYLAAGCPPVTFVDGVATATQKVAVPVPLWREEAGIIRFSVTSDGTTGSAWIERLEKAGIKLGTYAKSVLRSPDFKPTNGVTTEIWVLKGELFSDFNRNSRNIRVHASRKKLTTPNAEVACLIREKFSDEEIKAMGLTWIITMHEPIKDSDGYPRLLGAHRFGGAPWLSAYYGLPDNAWDRESGFAFARSQN